MKQTVLSCLLVCCLWGGASATVQDDTTIARADARVHQISDAKAYLEELERTLQMARRGDYGRIGRDELKQVEQAGREIEQLLTGLDRPSQLGTDERVRLMNAQELITATLRSDEKNRRICRLAPNTGSRLGKSECLTVAQRERRAAQAAGDMRELQRLNCRSTRDVKAPLESGPALEGGGGSC